jgi:hypothetical protein
MSNLVDHVELLLDGVVRVADDLHLQLQRMQTQPSGSRSRTRSDRQVACHDEEANSRHFSSAEMHETRTGKTAGESAAYAVQLGLKLGANGPANERLLRFGCTAVGE